MNRYLVLREHDGNKIGTVISLTPEIGTKRLKMGLVRMIEDGDARHVDVKRSDDGGIDFYSRNNGESVIKVTSDGVRGEDVSEIVNNITNLNTELGSAKSTWEYLNLPLGTGNFTITNNKFTGWTTSTIWSHAEVDVSPGEVYRVCIRVAYNPAITAHIIMCDSENNIVGSYLPYRSTAAIVNNEVITVPEGAVKMRIQSLIYTSTGPYIIVEKKATASVANTANVNALTKNTLILSIPQYMKSQFYGVKWPLIEAKLDSIAQGDAFIITTDSHFGAGKNNFASYAISQELMRYTPIKKHFFLGDSVSAYGTKDTCIECAHKINELQTALNQYGKMYLLKGNHDFTIRESAGVETGYTASEAFIYNFIMKNQENYVSGVPGKCYYYVDNPAQKIRYICLDACEAVNTETYWGVTPLVTQEQLDWLVDTALSFTGTDWSVLVFGHMSAVTEIPGYNTRLEPVAGILQAVKNKTTYSYTKPEWNINVSVDFSDKDIDVIAYWCGHNHNDRNAIVNNMLYISTAADATLADDSGITRYLGDPTESLMDVGFVDKVNKKLEIIRIGGNGSLERSLSY